MRADELPPERPDSPERGRGRNRLAALALALLAAIGAMLLLRSRDGGEPQEARPARLSASAPPAAGQPRRYSFRSNVPGASFVRFDRLPTVTSEPEGGEEEEACGRVTRPASSGGRAAARNGWRLVSEEKYRGLDAVLVVRGWDLDMTRICIAKDPNLLFFDGSRLIGLLYPKGEEGIGMNAIEIVGDHLRVWSEVTTAGQVNLRGTALSFDPVTGNDAVCGGRYRVPVVFGLPYAKARNILGAAGWRPQPGTEPGGVLTDDVRARFPEAESCSGTGLGYCRLSLASRDGRAEMSVTTIADGDIVRDYEVSCDGRPEK